MKVAIVVDGLGVGGIEKVCVDYTKLFLKLGHQITIINLDPKNNSLQKELPSVVKVKNFYFPRKLCGERYAQLVKRNPSGKYIYPVMYTGLKIIEYIKKLQYKTSGNKVFDLTIAFSGHFNDLTFVANDFVKTKFKLAWLHGALYGYLLISDGFYNLYKKINNLVCLVDDAQEEALVYNHNRELNIYKLYNPTSIVNKSIDHDKVVDLKKKYGKFIVMVSRFEYPHKDHYTVCKAFKLLKNKYDKQIDLLFIGDGPEKEKVEELVKTYPQSISKHIHFLGEKKDVQNYYKAAYLMVHASVAGEGLPTVQLEALAYGLPQVVTDSKVGPREILGDNKYGLLTKVQDPNDMSDKIIELLENKKLYTHYKIMSAERIKEFSPDVIESKLEIILKRITKN